MNCLSCNKVLPTPFLNLGESPLANSLPDVDSDRSQEKRYPLEVAFCKKCKMVQLTHLVDPEVLYKDYVYFSSYSSSFLEHAKKYAEDLHCEFGFYRNTKVLEIASNDGYLLKYIQPYGAHVLGIEPATNIADVANSNGVPTLNAFFNKKLVDPLLSEYGEADVIIGNNVLAHVSAINEFVGAVKECLSPDGYAVFEVPYLLNLLHNTEFDTIYHEHIFYYSILSLKNLFSRHGLELFDVKFQSIHGGTIRIFAQHRGVRPVNSVVSHYELIEKLSDLDSDLAYEGFANDVMAYKYKFVSLLEALSERGYSIAAYGAPAKSTTLLNFCQIDTNLIDFTVDISPHKQDKLLPGSRIPIYPREYLLEKMPDYTIILPWNFADEIQEQQAEYVERGGKFIVPMPLPNMV